MCCQDYDQTVEVGNVFEQGFWETWFSKAYVRLRERIYRRRHPLCQFCD